METHDLPKAQVPTLESLEMASCVGVGQVGQAHRRAADLWVTSCPGEEHRCLAWAPALESRPWGGGFEEGALL